ncbi:hypothetical protein XU18_0017 [Perkinsela sp. CCAP 1560/4]|nr:hypothetical protein XU18_0017 [Perkinsela sp. CCAP 1560/4]|eukprot:KNH09332.1 hypothetical protein XU18_0017 [Perkinsela sp. CCAP 1560/4]
MTWLNFFPRKFLLNNCSLTRVARKSFTEGESSVAPINRSTHQRTSEAIAKVCQTNGKRIYAEVSEENTYLAVSENPGYSAEHYAQYLFTKAHSCEVNVFLWKLKQKSELRFERKVDGSKVWYPTVPANIVLKVKTKFPNEKRKSKKAHILIPDNTYPFKDFEGYQGQNRRTHTSKVNNPVKASVISVFPSCQGYSHSKRGDYLTKLRKIYKRLQA